MESYAIQNMKMYTFEKWHLFPLFVFKHRFYSCHICKQIHVCFDKLGTML